MFETFQSLLSLVILLRILGFIFENHSTRNCQLEIFFSRQFPIKIIRNVFLRRSFFRQISIQILSWVEEVLSYFRCDYPRYSNADSLVLCFFSLSLLPQKHKQLFLILNIVKSSYRLSLAIIRSKFIDSVGQIPLYDPPWNCLSFGMVFNGWLVSGLEMTLIY